MISSWFQNLSWRSRRQLILVLIPLIPAILIASYLTYSHFDTATCYDGKLNQGERGIDCEGPCAQICSARIINPEISNVDAYPTLPNTYNLGAVLVNKNEDLGVHNQEFAFLVYDDTGNLIHEEIVDYDIRPQSEMLIFSGPIKLDKKPVQVDLNLVGQYKWQKFDDSVNQDLQVENIALSDQEDSPEVSAVVKNVNRRYFRNVPIGVLVKDENDQVVSISNTVVDLPANNNLEIQYTWPAPFPTSKGVCINPVDIVMAIDASGSMNSLSVDPPQPLTDIKDAAKMFSTLFSTDDSFGVISFANQANLVVDPRDVTDTTTRQSKINNILITKEAEEGYTNLVDALQYAGNLLQSIDNGRKQVIVLLTDGEPTDPDNDANPKLLAQLSASELIDNGIDLYAIGLGDNIDRGFLNSLTGDDGKTFTTLNADQVQTIYQQIATAICERRPYQIQVLPNLEP